MNKELYSNIKVSNGNWSWDLGQTVTDASLSMSTGQTNELTISFDDPGFAFLKNNKILMNSWVKYHALKFSVAMLELNKGGGEGGFTLTCRPRVVRALKNLKGKKMSKNISPSNWTIEECKRAGVKFVVQPSGRRSSISRDIPDAGQKGKDDATGWSTIQRLAEEIGFICYELNDVLYFGQPTWLIKRRTLVYAVSPSSSIPKVPSPAIVMTDYPEADMSLDNDSRRSISFSVPMESEHLFRPGGGVKIHGLPQMGGTYFITAVDFPLAGPGEVSVTAETPFNPAPSA